MFQPFFAAVMLEENRIFSFIDNITMYCQIEAFVGFLNFGLNTVVG